MPPPDYTPKHLNREQEHPLPWKPFLLMAASAVCLCLIMAPSVGRAASSPPRLPLTPPPDLPVPTATLQDAPVHSLKPTPRPVPSPSTTPYDYTQPVPLREEAPPTWFDDAVFIGASRTDGLRLYSGITGADFLCYKGVTVFNVMDRERQYLKIDGKKYSFLDALALKQYKKVYISLGINELGYYDNDGFCSEYAAFLDTVRALQPNAQIYLQSLIPINDAKARESRQANWLNNERITLYNDILAQLAAEKQVYLLDPGSALVDESGIIPYEATVDGLHFVRSWYSKWLDYLKTHTVALEGERE